MICSRRLCRRSADGWLESPESQSYEAAHGGRIAGTPRCEIEIQTEKKIVSPLTAKKVLAAREAEKVGEEGN